MISQTTVQRAVIHAMQAHFPKDIQENIGMEIVKTVTHEIWKELTLETTEINSSTIFQSLLFLQDQIPDKAALTIKRIGDKYVAQLSTGDPAQVGIGRLGKIPLPNALLMLADTIAREYKRRNK